MAFDKSNPSQDSKKKDSKTKSYLDTDLDKYLDDSDLSPSSDDSDVELIEDVDPDVPKQKPKVKINTNSTKNNSVNNKVLLAGISFAVAVVLAVVGYNSGKSREAKLAQQQQQQQVQKDAEAQAQSQQKKDEESNVKAGIDNLQNNTNNKSTSDLTDKDEVFSDLNGVPINSTYEIKSIKTVTEVVGYKKYRAQLGNGLEFYWLEVDYKGQPYKVQIPLSSFKELSSESGYVVVDAEVTTTSDNHELITYMSVRKDQKQYLDKVGK